MKKQKFTNKQRAEIFADYILDMYQQLTTESAEKSPIELSIQTFEELLKTDCNIAEKRFYQNALNRINEIRTNIS
jgi:uncharacterized protein YqhQ